MTACDTPYPVPVMGLTSDGARSKIALELRRIINGYSTKGDRRLMPRSLWRDVLLFLKTLEGAVLVLCSCCLIYFELSIYWMCGFLSARRMCEAAATFQLLIPCCAFNIFVSHKLKRAEWVRPFAQVTEILQILEDKSADYSSSGSFRLCAPNICQNNAVCEPPGSKLISVFRDQQWVQMPHNMIAEGDVFKLGGNQTFPVDAVSVRLVAVPYSDTVDSGKAARDETVFIYPIISPHHRRYAAGDIFVVDGGETNASEQRKGEHDSFTISTRTEQRNEKRSPPAIGTFKALSFSCTPLVSGFLDTAAHSKASSSRNNTKFFEILSLVQKFLLGIFLIVLCITIGMNLLWTVRMLTRPTHSKSHHQCFTTVYTGNLWMPTLLLIISFLPLVHRILVELTDVWGNARLQSLFQWLQDTRLPCGTEMGDTREATCNGVTVGGDRPRSSKEMDAEARSSASFSRSSTSSWSSADSTTTSIDSNMSVSRLPFRNQVVELFEVLSQGLDGPSNLLHTLNSTTSVVFVDKKGILTDTHRTVQEVCIVKDTDVSTLSVSPYSSSTNPSAPRSPTKHEKDSTTTLEKRVEHITGEDRTTLRLKPSHSTLNFPCGNPLLLDRVVLSVLLDEYARDGQRFESSSIATSCIAVLKPLVTLMSVTRLPLSGKQFEDFSGCHWLFSQTIQDVFQSEDIFDEAYKECVCSLRSITGVSHAGISRFRISRFFIVLQSTIHQYVFGSISPSLPQATPPRYQCNTLLCAWILKEIATGHSQIVAKGDPRHILRHSTHYFNGKSVLPVSKLLRRSLLQIVDQWKGDGLECLAFSYHPLGEMEHHLCLHRLDEHSLFVLEPQVFISTIPHETPHFVNKAQVPLSTYEKPYNSDPSTQWSYGTGRHLFVYKMGDKKEWNSLRIFPGPRSSIGSLPRVPYWFSNALTGAENIPPCVERDHFPGLTYNQRLNRTGFYDYNNTWTPEYIQESLLMKAPRITRGDEEVCTQHKLSGKGNEKTHLTFRHCCILPKERQLRTDEEQENEKQEDEKQEKEKQCGEPLHESNGSFIRRLMAKQIFLGMIALRLSTPPELAARIQGFHEAGIRFVYMSRENDAKTRAVGCLLGLETDWNCLISLEPSMNRVVNAVGNVVVPSGIESIQAHIKDIDNVPLQVSLFSRGTPTSMRKMIQILQENGEVVTCIGSAQRTSNFLLFEQANCSISVSIDAPPFCKECLGRRCVGHVNRHLFSSLPLEFEVSAALSSLPCALHINFSSWPQLRVKNGCVENAFAISPSDPRWLVELLHEAFKESRRIVKGIEQSISFYTGVNIGFIAPCFVLVNVLCTPPFFRIIAAIAILLLCLPFVSITFLHNPAEDNIMKEFPLRLRDHEEKKKDVWTICVVACLRFVPSSFMVCYPFTSPPVFLSVGRWVRCVEVLYSASEMEACHLLPPLVHCQLMALFLILLFSCVMSLSFVNRGKGFTKMIVFRNKWLIVVWCLIFLLYGGLTVLELTLTKSWDVLTKPSIPFLVAVGMWPVCLVIIHKVIKRKEQKKYCAKQKYLKLLFTTRLGMWSPK